MNLDTSRLKEINKTIIFGFNESKGIWVLQDITEYQVSQQALEVDKQGLESEIARLQSLKAYWQSILIESEEEIDKAGAESEIERINLALDENINKLQGIQQALGQMRGRSNADEPDRG